MSGNLNGGQVFITGGSAEDLPAGTNVVFVNPNWFSLGFNQVGLFAGMTTAQLQAALVNAQNAVLAIMSGNKVMVANYTQGDGGKGVTYQQANLASATMLVRQLQQALGLICQARRPGRVIFR